MHVGNPERYTILLAISLARKSPMVASRSSVRTGEEVVVADEEAGAGEEEGLVDRGENIRQCSLTLHHKHTPT